MGRSAVERMSKTLRTAVKPSQLLSNCAGCTEDAFIKAEDFAVQFYANLDNTRELGRARRGSPTRSPRRAATPACSSRRCRSLTRTCRPRRATRTATRSRRAPRRPARARLTVTRLAEGIQTDYRHARCSRTSTTTATRWRTGSTGLDASQLNRLLSVEMVLTIQSTEQRPGRIPRPTSSGSCCPTRRPSFDRGRSRRVQPSWRAQAAARRRGLRSRPRGRFDDGPRDARPDHARLHPQQPAVRDGTTRTTARR